MVAFLAKLIAALSSNSRPWEIASGLTFGVWLALIPGGNLLWLGIFLIAFFLKHNISALFLSLGVFRLGIHLLDPFLDFLGGFILNLTPLGSFFAKVYSIPFVPFTKFNNTVVMGGFILGLLLWVPLFLVFRILINLYRNKIAYKLAESRFFKFLKGIPILSRIISLARKISGYTV